jgi:general secretion pathway protein A
VHYEAHWGLKAAPFENVPDPDYYFPSSKHEEGLHRLIYGVEAKKGAVMLTGEIGCGKTLLSRALILHLAREKYDVALIANPAFEGTGFLAEVLYQFRVEATGTKVDLLHALNDHLLANHRKQVNSVVVVDEAQAIGDDLVFEDLRMLLNFQLNDQFLLTLVLLGQPELRDRVLAIKQFAQRIAIRYHLRPFSLEDSAAYIRFRLKAAGTTQEIFSKDAIQRIFDLSEGIPRNINSLCDMCLLIGYLDAAKYVDDTIVDRIMMDVR